MFEILKYEYEAQCRDEWRRASRRKDNIWTLFVGSFLVAVAVGIGMIPYLVAGL